MLDNLIDWKSADDLEISEIWDLYKKYINAGQVDLIASFGFGRDLVDYAEGCHIYTKSGKKILDFTGGIGVLNHGHNHPDIIKARKEYQESKKMEVHKNFFSPYIAILGQNISKILPGNLNVSYFPNSGAESVEGAIKMAYKYHNGNRKSLLYADISFHGKLLGAASATGSPEISFEFPKIPNTHPFKYNKIDSVIKLIEDLKVNGHNDIYAIIIEPFNASSLRECSEEFLIKLRQICYEEDIVLIFDEVYTGWSKTGELFYFMRYDIIPDILTYAKSFGGGKASISGYTCTDNIFNKAYGNLNDATLHSTTYNGFGEETVTAIEAIKIIYRDDYISKSKDIYDFLYPGLLDLKKKYPDIISDVRGAGALNGIIINSKYELLGSVLKLVPGEFFKDKRFLPKLYTASIISELYNVHNILTFYGSNVEIPLIISPSNIISKDDMNYFLSSLDKTLSKGLVKLVAKFIKNKFFK
jgi:putrescine aminotransferase